MTFPTYQSGYIGDGTDLRYVGPPETDFDRLDRRLQAVETKFVYIGVPDPSINGNRRLWNLAGNYGGAEGLDMAPKALGLMMAPFQQKYSEGAYQVGATIERTDWQKREMSIGVMVGNSMAPDTSFRYRMLEERWWGSWSETEDGWFGCFTRTHGWRWLRVRLAEETKNAFELDPVAFENNFMQWDFTIVATQPFWSKRREETSWKNPVETSTPFATALAMDPWVDLKPGVHVGESTLVLPNRSTLGTYVQYMCSAPGLVWLQDGANPQMIGPFVIYESDGMTLFDTDPTARMITAAKDPVDNAFFQITRNSQLLDFLLHDITDAGEPAWKRAGAKLFSDAPIPPRSQARLKVRHSNPNGVITARLPQRFKMAYGQ